MKLICFVRSLVISRLNYSANAMHLRPPKLSGVTTLDREQFSKIVSVPTILIQAEHIKDTSAIVKYLKKFLLKVDKLHPVSNGKVFLNPDLISRWEDLPVEILQQYKVGSFAFKFEDLELTYQNWRADDLVKAIIPDGIEPATSYSKIGHILHMNLKDNLLPYKTAIAQIYMDKIAGCKTVINKAQSIDNTFRNFHIDLLLGEPDYQVQVKENGVVFEFDFSTVYWNPRLSSEHERLVKMLNANDYFYDVFAGVGPFAVPSGKKRVNVLANDLNPHSFKWLEHNVKKNKVSNQVATFNKDGRDFILQDVKNNLLERIEQRNNEVEEYSIHIAMNLPGLAVTFLDAFVGLLKENKNGILNSSTIPTPICHCYCFVKGVDDPKVMAKNLVEEHIGFKLLQDETLKEITYVRNVAPNKDMMRVDILLTSDILFDTLSIKRSPEESFDSIPSKKLCN